MDKKILREKIVSLQQDGEINFEDALVDFIVSLVADPSLLDTVKVEIITEKEKRKTDLENALIKVDAELSELKK